MPRWRRYPCSHGDHNPDSEPVGPRPLRVCHLPAEADDRSTQHGCKFGGLQPVPALEPAARSPRGVGRPFNLNHEEIGVRPPDHRHSLPTPDRGSRVSLHGQAQLYRIEWI